MDILLGKERLESMATEPSLKKAGWDTYDAKPLADEAVSKARLVLDQLAPDVLASAISVPTVTGGVQIEWHAEGGDFEIEIHPDSDVASIVSQISQGVSTLKLIA